jgi:superfamily II DNA or RNA helicase
MTKSRSFFAQTAGRVLRPLPGVVDAFPDREQDAERRAAIAASEKPSALLLDFVGNVGKHQLMTPEDLLGGSYSDAEVKLAKKKRLEMGDGDPRAALEAARAELRKIAAAVKATVRASVSEVFDPFTAFGMNRASMEESSVRFGWKPISAAQRDMLVSRGMSYDEASQLSKTMANKLIGTILLRQKKGLATFKQMRELARRGYSVPKNISFKRASELLTERKP